MSNARAAKALATKINLPFVLMAAEQASYTQVVRAAEAKAAAVEGSQGAIEATRWHERAMRETAAIAELRTATEKLLEAAAGGLGDLTAMVAAADRGEVWVVNVGTRERLENLRAAIAPFSNT